MLLSTLAASADDKTPEPKGDLAKLQGTWTAKVGPEKNIPIAITIKGNAVALKITAPDGQEFTSNGEVKLDETARPHKKIDWVKFTGGTGDPVPDNLGLYEFVDANTLRVCSGGPGNERPTEFKAGEDGPPNLLTLNRMGAEKNKWPGPSLGNGTSSRSYLTDKNTTTEARRIDAGLGRRIGASRVVEGYRTRSLIFTSPLKATLTFSFTTPDRGHRDGPRRPQHCGGRGARPRKDLGHPGRVGLVRHVGPGVLLEEEGLDRLWRHVVGHHAAAVVDVGRPVREHRVPAAVVDDQVSRRAVLIQDDVLDLAVVVGPLEGHI